MRTLSGRFSIVRLSKDSITKAPIVLICVFYAQGQLLTRGTIHTGQNRALPKQRLTPLIISFYLLVGSGFRVFHGARKRLEASPAKDFLELLPEYFVNKAIARQRLAAVNVEWPT